MRQAIDDGRRRWIDRLRPITVPKHTSIRPLGSVEGFHWNLSSQRLRAWKWLKSQATSRCTHWLSVTRTGPGSLVLTTAARTNKTPSWGKPTPQPYTRHHTLPLLAQAGMRLCPNQGIGFDGPKAMTIWMAETMPNSSKPPSTNVRTGM